MHLCTKYLLLRVGRIVRFIFLDASELSEASLQCNAMFSACMVWALVVVVEGKSNKVLVDCHIIDMTFGTRRFSLAHSC